jgi:hypothetical protein
MFHSLKMKWTDDMNQDPAVLESYCTPEIHMRYRMSRKEGNALYDLLLKK